MNKLILLVGICVMVTVNSLHAEEVDFRAANPVLQTLVEAVTSADDQVDFAYPRFDESFSDLKAEKLKYDLQGSVKNTPWLNGGHADVTASTRYWADRTPGRIGVKMDGTSTVRTDTLALLRYAAVVTLRKTPEHDLDPKFIARYQAHFKRLAVATSLEQVHALLLSGQRLARDMVKQEIDEFADTVRCLEAGTCTNSSQDLPKLIAFYKSELADYQKTMQAHDRLVIETKSESGKIREISICSADIKLFIPEREITKEKDFLIPGKGCGVFTDTTVSANLEAFFKMQLQDLDQRKKNFEMRMIGVQSGDFEHKEYVQDRFRQALITFKDAIRGVWQ